MKRLFLSCLVGFLGLTFVIPISSSWSAGTLKVTTPLVQQATTEKEEAKRHRRAARRNVKAVMNAAKTACSKITDISIGPTIKKSWTTTDCSATTQALISPFTYGYAKFYSFTVSSKSTVTFHLYTPKVCKPVAYPQMVLRKGKTTSGSYKKRVDASCDKSGKLRTVLTAGTYTLEVASALWCIDTCSGYSTTGPFVLKTSCKGDCSTDTLKVTTPNGGEKWTTGKTYQIKWSKGIAGAKVKIQLYKSDKHNKWISKSTKNDGKHSWKVPSTVKTGAAYKIKITSKTKKTVTDSSNKNFTITKASSAGTLKVTTPNGGEKWTTGKTYQIKWSKGNAGAKVKILLLKNGKAYKWISKSTKNDGKHSWKVPSTVKTGAAYKIKITSKTKKTVTDSSNKNFTIKK